MQKKSTPVPAPTHRQFMSQNKIYNARKKKYHY